LPIANPSAEDPASEWTRVGNGLSAAPTGAAGSVRAINAKGINDKNILFIFGPRLIDFDASCALELLFVFVKEVAGQHSWPREMCDDLAEKIALPTSPNSLQGGFGLIVHYLYALYSSTYDQP
jgi:hypothetical protein